MPFPSYRGVEATPKHQITGQNLYPSSPPARIAASRAGVTPDTDLAQINTGEFTLETLPNVAEEGWWKNGIMFSTFPRK